MTMVTVKDAAARFNVSAQTMRNWCKEGRIPGAQQVGRYWQVPETALPEAGTQPPAPEPVLDTSELQPRSDEEIAETLKGTYDEGGRFSQGMDPSVISRGFAEPEPPFPAESPVTLDEVRERLVQMLRTVDNLGSLAGQLHGALGVAISHLDKLGDQVRLGEVAEIQAAASALHGGTGGAGATARIAEEIDASVGRIRETVRVHPAADQAALDELLAGKTVPLETLDEVLDAEPAAEIDSDPRELWEIPAADPRDVWEDAHHE